MRETNKFNDKNSINNKNNNKIIKFRNKIKSQRGTLENG
jgi:hypothetical protein